MRPCKQLTARHMLAIVLKLSTAAPLQLNHFNHWIHTEFYEAPYKNISPS